MRAGFIYLSGAAWLYFPRPQGGSRYGLAENQSSEKACEHRIFAADHWPSHPWPSTLTFVP